MGLDNENSLKYYENNLKQLKTASTNSPWAYFREGLFIYYLFIYSFVLLYCYLGGEGGSGGLLSEFYGIRNRKCLEDTMFELCYYVPSLFVRKFLLLKHLLLTRENFEMNGVKFLETR